MTPVRTVPLAELYVEDETAWLDRMAELARHHSLAEIDFDNLAEYLSDMARRDRREVRSRLVVLMAHLLKWEHQPERRSGSWRATIVTQRQELAELFESATLRNHAEAVLMSAYENALELASAETGLAAGLFPAECPYTLEQALTFDVVG